MKQIIKKLLPQKAIDQYHKTLAVGSKYFYDNPSDKLKVIGVTGTNGKSTTVLLISKILEEAGYVVGETSTISFKIGKKEWLNDKKMTMLGRLALQKLLKEMVSAGCHYAVIETSSEGIRQHRHLSINYDVAVFTNLTPEHIEAHGGFDNYRQAKEKLFAKLRGEKHKIFDGQEVPKIIVANLDDEHADYFIDYWADEKYGYGIDGQEKTSAIKSKIEAMELHFNAQGVSFKIYDLIFNLKMFGRFNVYNALASIAVAQSQGISIDVCKSALEKVDIVPGRMEFIDEGQPFKVVIDYAPEPASMKALYQTIKDHSIAGEGRIIHVLGSCGGGRDISRRPILGEMAAKQADYVIVTNEDPYDDDPVDIIDQVAVGADRAGKIIDQNLFKIEDRREAIVKALSLAQAGDLVLLTGKGSEQAICIAGGEKIKWDEREVVRQLLQK